MVYAIEALSRYPPAPSALVIEVGCGAGQYIKGLSIDYPNYNYLGFDFSHPGLTYATARDSFPNIQFICSDVLRLPLPDDTVDFLFGFDIYEHLEDLESGIQESARVIKPGGRIHAAIPCDGERSTIVGMVHKWLPFVSRLRVRYSGHVVPLTFSRVIKTFDQNFTNLEVKYSLHFISQVRDLFYWCIDGPLGLDHFDYYDSKGLPKFAWRTYRRICYILDLLGARESVKKDRSPKGALLCHITGIKN